MIGPACCPSRLLGRLNPQRPEDPPPERLTCLGQNGRAVVPVESLELGIQNCSDSWRRERRGGREGAGAGLTSRGLHQGGGRILDPRLLRVASRALVESGGSPRKPLTDLRNFYLVAYFKRTKNSPAQRIFGSLILAKS